VPHNACQVHEVKAHLFRVLGRVEDFVPVDYPHPRLPPTPEAIADELLTLLDGLGLSPHGIRTLDPAAPLLSGHQMEGFPRASSMTPAQRWLASLWPFVRAELPAAPARVLEIGCGPFGGFVPGLLHGGYEAVGIDRNAPQAPGYCRMDFEQYEPPEPVDAIVASRSLHHVADLEDVLWRAAEALRPGGVLVVLEWAREQFDADTAHWCFARLDSSAEPGWLQRRQAGWSASGDAWEDYFEAWARREHLHRGDRIVGALDARFDRRSCTYGPYFFTDLGGIAEADEQAGIDAGELRANGIRYIGRRRP
jgi:SAM-dependent methyltransferase